MFGDADNDVVNLLRSGWKQKKEQNKRASRADFRPDAQTAHGAGIKKRWISTKTRKLKTKKQKNKQKTIRSQQRRKK